ncbi:hypothetical protein GCM10010399_34460 [Dactylosporangium fulvum]
MPQAVTPAIRRGSVVIVAASNGNAASNAPSPTVDTAEALSSNRQPRRVAGRPTDVPTLGAVIVMAEAWGVPQDNS